MALKAVITLNIYFKKRLDKYQIVLVFRTPKNKTVAYECRLI